MSVAIHRKVDIAYQFVREGIIRGTWPVGGLIPTEEELALTLKCNRGTVGRALSRLVQEGLIERRPSVGTKIVYNGNPKHLAPLELDAVAFVHPSATHEGTWRTLRGFQEAAANANTRAVTLSTGMDFRKEAEIIGRLDEFAVKGAVLFPVITSPRDLAYYTQMISTCNFPIVILTMNIPSLERPAVMTDHFHAGYSMTRYLLDKGIRKIGFLDNFVGVRHERHLGYRQAMEEAGITDFQKYVHLESSCNPKSFAINFDSGAPQLCRTYLQEHPDLEGVVGADDYLGVGLIHASQELGIQVPLELKIVGINNYSFSTNHPIGLTTYNVDYEKMGRTSHELLSSIIQQKNKNSPREIRLRGEIIQRQSA